MATAWYDGDHKPQQVNLRWWDESKAEVHKALFALVDHLREHQNHHHLRNLHHARMYGNLDLLGLDYFNYARARDYENRVTYNVIESAIDTIHSDITANKSKPMFLTDKGQWKQKRMAQGLNRFIVGQFHHTRVYRNVSPKVARDAMIFGTGVAKIYTKNNMPWCERVIPDDILVDDLEARDGAPRQYFQIASVDRQKLLSMPAVKKSRKLTEEIRLCRRVSSDDQTDTIADLVRVYEGWFLPSHDGADDGRHVMAVERGTIVDEKWEKSYPPFEFLRYKDRTLGMWGKGVAEILDGGQVAINELLWKIHMSLKLTGPKVFVNPGSGVTMAHLNNEIWGIIECVDKPHLAIFESVPPDLFRQLGWEIEQAYGLVGVNLLSARSEIPAGMSGASGRALRLYTDTKSKRFLDFHSNYDKFHMGLSEQYIALNKEIHAENRAYEVRNEFGDLEELGEHKELSVLAPGAGSQSSEWEEIKWSDVNLERDRYVMQAWPTNLLSLTPSARMDDVEQLLKVFPELQPYAMSLMDFPDLRSVTSLETGSSDLLRQVVEAILYDGKMQTPEPMMDLQSALKVAQKYYLRGRLEGVPEENLSKLRKFMVRVQDMLNPKPPPDAGQAPLAPEGGPPVPGQALGPPPGAGGEQLPPEVAGPPEAPAPAGPPTPGGPPAPGGLPPPDIIGPGGTA